MSIKTNLVRALTGVIFVITSLTAQAQIGYQVSLLNTATGEPKANVTVNVQVTITDSQGKTVCSETKQATSNDFGVLSLTVGKEDTFKNADSGALPFFIAVSVDGKLISKSQILSVPMAEIAGKLKSSFTKEDLLGTWKDTGHGDTYEIFIFSQDSTGRWQWRGSNTGEIYSDYEFEYEIEGNSIYMFYKDEDGDGRYSELRWKNGVLHNGSFSFHKQ